MSMAQEYSDGKIGVRPVKYEYPKVNQYNLDQQLTILTFADGSSITSRVVRGRLIEHITESDK